MTDPNPEVKKAQTKQVYVHPCSICTERVMAEDAGAFPDNEHVVCGSCQHKWAIKEMNKCFPMFRRLP